MDTLTPSLSTLHDDAVALLKQRRATPASARAPIQRALAEVIVSSRALFTKSDGRRDIDGRTKAYQRFIREVFEDAGEGADRVPIMASLRYHVGQVNRERYGVEALAEEYGLDTADPREKSKARRNDRAATVRALEAQDTGGSLSAISQLRVAVRHVVSNARPEELAKLSADERGEADAALADIEVVVGALRMRLRGAA